MLLVASLAAIVRHRCPAIRCYEREQVPLSRSPPNADSRSSRLWTLGIGRASDNLRHFAFVQLLAPRPSLSFGLFENASRSVFWTFRSFAYRSLTPYLV